MQIKVVWESLPEQLLHWCMGGPVESISWYLELRCGNHSWFGQHGTIRMISTFLFLPCSCKPLLDLSVAHVYVPVRDKTVLSVHDISSEMGEVYIDSFMLLPWAKMSTNGLPKEHNILSAGSGLGSTLFWGFDPDGQLTCVSGNMMGN